MRLDCLVVARDSNLLRVLTAALVQAKIEPKVCASAEDAMARLHAVKFDAVMVDCVEFEEGFEVLLSIRKTPPNRKTIVFAIVEEDTSVQQRAQTGASFVLERPMHPDILLRSIRAAHSLMLAEHRRYFRYRVALRASLTRGGHEVRVNVTNISSGGMAVHFDKPLEVGWTGTVEFVVPETKLSVHAKGEVVWMSSDLVAGIRFLNLPEPVREPLEEWLNLKAREVEIDLGPPLPSPPGS